MAGQIIERTIHLDDPEEGVDLPFDEWWRLIGTSEGWSEWLVDRADLDVREGADGEVIDDGQRRTVHVERVLPGVGVTFVWSSGDDIARVTMEIHVADDGRRLLRIAEEAIDTCADCPLRADASATRWAVRACLLCFAARAVSRV